MHAFGAAAAGTVNGFEMPLSALLPLQTCFRDEIDCGAKKIHPICRNFDPSGQRGSEKLCNLTCKFCQDGRDPSLAAAAWAQKGGLCIASLIGSFTPCLLDALSDSRREGGGARAVIKSYFRLGEQGARLDIRRPATRDGPQEEMKMTEGCTAGASWFAAVSPSLCLDLLLR